MNSKVQTTNEEILTICNGIVNAWRSQFDNPPVDPLDFMIQGGELHLNGNAICPVELIDPEGFTYETESICMLLADDTCITIHIFLSAEDKITTCIERQRGSDIDGWES